MKRVSVKARMALWLTGLTVCLAALLVGFLLSISSTVAARNAAAQLEGAVRSNAQAVRLVDGKLETGSDFRFYQNGVTTLVYSGREALLAGQLPVAFPAGVPFQSGTTRWVDGADGQYLALDLWVPSGWEEGVWLRGILPATDQRQVARRLLGVSLMVLPVFLLLAALGGFWIAKAAFRPLDHITATATAISEAKDLTRRIGIPPGRDEFSQLAATFDQLFARLERSFEAERQFTSDASHELRTPVSIIRGACEYGEKYDETAQERQETLAMIRRQADSMSRLIDQLLAMTRLEQGTERIRLEPMDLGAWAGDLGQELDLETAAAEGLFVRGDPALLERLVRNLAENARKYAKPGGAVTLTAERRGDEALLTVRDQGDGIPAELQEKIWNRFYQADPARSGEGDGGAGLGLAIVKQIAQLHGGEMTLESAPGGGSAFTLHLPLAKNS